MLEEFCRQAISNEIKTKLPHLVYPAIMYAKVTKSTELTDTYEWAIKCQDKNGEVKECTCTAHYYSYNLKILDKNKAVDSTYPEIPEVRSQLQFKTNDIVVVALVNGELTPFIVGGV